MVTNPIFGRPTNLIEQMDIFVLMPFSERLAPVFTNHLTKVAKDLMLTIYRADDFFAVNMVMSDIWNAICGAGIVVADCTDNGALGDQILEVVLDDRDLDGLTRSC